MDPSQRTLATPRVREKKGRRRLRTDVEFYLRSVARRWKREVGESDHVLLFSPYLTSRTAEAVLGTTPGGRCEVYTVSNAENFASGASSIHTLMKLREHGCSLYDLPGLRAKIVLVPGAFASIGSQNATRQGTMNKEATSVFTAPEAVALIRAMVEPWLDERRAITADMIDELNLALPPLIRAMRKAQRACKALDEKVCEEEQLRVESERGPLAEEEQIRRADEERALRAEEDQIRREAELRRIEEERRELLRRNVSDVRQRVQAVHHGNSVDRATAAKFVRESTWWLTHPSGPVRAAGHSRRLVGSEGDPIEA